MNGFRCDNPSCATLFKLTDGSGCEGTLEMLLAQHWTCPVCSGARIVPTTKREGARLIELTVHQLWNAVNGRGLPDQAVTERLLKTVFTRDTVREIKMHPAPSGAIVIEEMTFMCGLTLYFGVSGGQAAVYKVTREKENADADQEVRPRRAEAQAEDAGGDEGAQGLPGAGHG